MNKKVIIKKRILKIDPIQTFTTDKYKVVFYCESSNGENRTCVYWDMGRPPDIQVGDDVILTGRMQGEVFIVWDLKIDKKKEAK